MFGAGGRFDENATASDDWWDKGKQIKVTLTASYGMKDWYVTARQFPKKLDCSLTEGGLTCGY